MTVSELDDIDEASSLTGSDLKGLLKAARLAKYVPDSKSSSDPVVFEKSANLFDLVRSKIDSPEQVVKADELQDQQIDGAILNSENDVSSDTSDASEIDFFEEIPPEITTEETTQENALFWSEPSLEEDKPLEDKNMSVESNDSPQNESDSGSTGSVELNEIETNSDSEQNPETLNDDPYVAAKLEFDQLLKIETDRFQNLSETLFLVSDAIVEASEEKLKAFILETASKLSGDKIDEIPEKYLAKITQTISEFTTKTDDVNVLLNDKDLDSLTKTKNFKDFLYSFTGDKTLKRGEFKIQSGKLTGQVKLHENLNTEIEDE